MFFPRVEKLMLLHSIILLAFISQIACDSTLKSNEIKFKFYDILREELPEKKPPDSVLKELLTFANNIAKATSAYLSMFETFYVLYRSNPFKKSASNYENGVSIKEIENEKYKNLLQEIKYIMGDLLSVEDAVELKQFPQADLILKKILRNFADPGSEFQDHPELLLMVLFQFADIIVSFMNSDWRNSELNQTYVPCIFLYTIKDLFKSTLFYRLGEIDYLLFVYGDLSWYSEVLEILNNPFKPGGYPENNIADLNCCTEEQYSHIDVSQCSQLENATTSVASNLAHYVEMKITCTNINVALASVTDRLGIGTNQYVCNENGLIDYFRLIRHRLEMHFDKAYQKVEYFCQSQRYEPKNITESGWLTVNLVAVFIKGGSCTPRLLGGKIERCKQYAKFIVDYPSGKRYYTVRIAANPDGWVLLNEKIRFDEAPKETQVQIEIWKENSKPKDGTPKEEKLFELNTILSFMANSTTYDNSTSKAGWKLFVVSIWRDNFKYDDFSFISDKFNTEMYNR